MVSLQAIATEVVAGVRDPELPMLTLADLGVLRHVDVRAGEDGEDGRVVVSLTPTYLGCPALATMRDDVVQSLQEAGFANVEVRVVPDPPWSTDWISERGRVASHPAHLGVRRHRLQGPVPVPGLPGAVRARQRALTGDPR
jgi:ring-1,2-phenylacetyl-CoA epoxidase subunit PaaD